LLCLVILIFNFLTPKNGFPNFPGITTDHIYVTLGDPSCIGYKISCEKISKQTNTQTLRDTLPTRLSSTCVKRRRHEDDSNEWRLQRQRKKRESGWTEERSRNKELSWTNDVVEERVSRLRRQRLDEVEQFPQQEDELVLFVAVSQLLEEHSEEERRFFDEAVPDHLLSHRAHFTHARAHTILVVVIQHDATTDPGWPCVSSCSCPCLELSAVFRQRRTVTGGLSTTATEDSTLQDILWRGCYYLSRVTVNTWLFSVCWVALQRFVRDSATLNVNVYNNNNNQHHHHHYYYRLYHLQYCRHHCRI